MKIIRFLFSKTFFKNLLMLIGVLFISVILLLFWLDLNTRHGEQIEVPDVAGMTLEEAIIVLEERDLTHAILDTSSYNPNFPYHSVIEQIPSSGAQVKQARKIYLSINRSGYKAMSVPYVVGKTLRQAKPALNSSGFKIGKLTYKKYVAKDEVLLMKFKNRSIQEGDYLPRTSVIDLELGDGTGGFIVQPLDRNSPYRFEKQKTDIRYESKTTFFLNGSLGGRSIIFLYGFSCTRFYPIWHYRRSSME